MTARRRAGRRRRRRRLAVAAALALLLFGLAIASLPRWLPWALRLGGATLGVELEPADATFSWRERRLVLEALNGRVPALGITFELPRVELLLRRVPWASAGWIESVTLLRPQLEIARGARERAAWRAWWRRRTGHAAGRLRLPSVRVEHATLRWDERDDREAPLRASLASAYLRCVDGAPHRVTVRALRVTQAQRGVASLPRAEVTIAALRPGRVAIDRLVLERPELDLRRWPIPAERLLQPARRRAPRATPPLELWIARARVRELVLEFALRDRGETLPVALAGGWVTGRAVRLHAPGWMPEEVGFAAIGLELPGFGSLARAWALLPPDRPGVCGYRVDDFQLEACREPLVRNARVRDLAGTLSLCGGLHWQAGSGEGTLRARGRGVRLRVGDRARGWRTALGWIGADGELDLAIPFRLEAPLGDGRNPERARWRLRTRVIKAVGGVVGGAIGDAGRSIGAALGSFFGVSRPPRTPPVRALPMPTFEQGAARLDAGGRRAVALWARVLEQAREQGDAQPAIHIAGLAPCAEATPAARERAWWLASERARTVCAELVYAHGVEPADLVVERPRIESVRSAQAPPRGARLWLATQ